MNNFQVFEEEESKGSNEEEKQPQGTSCISNRTRTRSVLKKLQSTTAHETDNSKSSTGTKLGHTIGPNQSTEGQPDGTGEHCKDAPLSKLLL